MKFFRWKNQKKIKQEAHTTILTVCAPNPLRDEVYILGKGIDYRSDILPKKHPLNFL